MNYSGTPNPIVILIPSQTYVKFSKDNSGTKGTERKVSDENMFKGNFHARKTSSSLFWRGATNGKARRYRNDQKCCLYNQFLFSRF